MEVRDLIDRLKSYNGPELKIMEVCGTHTAAIFKGGIRDLISPKIKLISGPGCPVCVTPTAFVDTCTEYALKDGHVLYSFGDMLKVPGTKGSLSDMKGGGARVEIMYSPFEVIKKAKEKPEITHVIAAVGFETTAPIYALLVKELEKSGIDNVKIVTALKTIVPALEWICENQNDIDGFICPGHVSVIIGSKPYEQLAEKYRKPFVVAGFEPEHLLAVIYDIVCQIEEGRHEVRNLYKNAVRDGGNVKAEDVIGECYKAGPATWRGLGSIDDSGLYLADRYQRYDGGSFGLDEDMELPESCACREVITGAINPDQCPMFGTACSPTSPYGPCMVSAEGACGIWYRNRR